MSPTPSPLRLEIHRVYEDPGTEGHGYRILVDRLWPRGISKHDAALDEWARDVAPSTELRRWYRHDPARFDQFARRYHDELTAPPASQAAAHLFDVARDQPVVLLTATRDLERSGARVLQDHLWARQAVGGGERQHGPAGDGDSEAPRSTSGRTRAGGRDLTDDGGR